MTIASVTSGTAATLSANATTAGTITATIGTAGIAPSDAQASGFIGWSPETDNVAATYSVAAVNALALPPSRLPDALTPVEQRGRGLMTQRGGVNVTPSEGHVIVARGAGESGIPTYPACNTCARRAAPPTPPGPAPRSPHSRKDRGLQPQCGRTRRSVVASRNGYHSHDL